MERIFQSAAFQEHQVFEDGPWWLPELYKILYHRFPGAKFILLTRDKDAWFDSMLSHSGGMVLGNTKRHCKIYRREADFYDLMEAKNLSSYDGKQIDNLLTLEGHREHYTAIHDLRNREIVDFFHDKDPGQFFTCALEDPNKWTKLGAFMRIDVPNEFNVHANRSK